MEKLVDEVINLNMEDIVDFNFPLNKLLLIIIEYKGVRFDFVAYFRDNPNLLCFGTGSQSPYRKTKDGKRIEPPYFHRWSWYKYFEENFLGYADPMHYLDNRLRIGWCVGDKDMWYLETISEVIKKIARNRKVLNNNILFYGSSGGGFTAINLATFIKDSHVLVNNAQFFILNYHPYAVNRLFSLLMESFSLSSRDEIYKLVKHRLNCIELFKKEKYVPSIEYYVNVNSDADMNSHFFPFLNELLKLPYFKDDFSIHCYHNDRGHNPMSNKRTLSAINNLIINKMYNDNSSIDLGSFKVDVPEGFYISETSISNGKTSISLEEIDGENGDNILSLVDEYVSLKKNKFDRDVRVDSLKFDEGTIMKATVVNNERYVHYWFEKNDRIFHFYSSTAFKGLDDIIIGMCKSLCER